LVPVALETTKIKNNSILFYIETNLCHFVYKWWRAKLVNAPCGFPVLKLKNAGTMNGYELIDAACSKETTCVRESEMAAETSKIDTSTRYILKYGKIKSSE